MLSEFRLLDSYEPSHVQKHVLVRAVACMRQFLFFIIIPCSGRSRSGSCNTPSPIKKTWRTE
jgi:hypothetical protein